jgi:hypothetical protein
MSPWSDTERAIAAATATQFRIASRMPAGGEYAHRAEAMVDRLLAEI